MAEGAWRLGGREAAYAALALALLGLALLYFWPMQSEYAPMALASVSIARDGQWVSVRGAADAVSDKAAGYSVRLCDETGCATVSVGGKADAGVRPLKGQNVSAWGEVAHMQANAFIRAHRIEIG